MNRPAAKGEPTRGPDTELLDPTLAADEAKSLLKSMRRFLADSDLQSSRIRVAVTIPIGVICVLSWVALTVFGSLFQGGTKHPEIMLITGGVMLLIGLHAWLYRGPSLVATALLATVITLIYVFAVFVNGLLPTIFMSAVIIALHSVAVPRTALMLSLVVLALTPPLVWLASGGQINYPYLFRSMSAGIMAVTFLQLLCRSNARFKGEALRVAQGLEALNVSLGASLEQALFERRRAENALAAMQAADARLITIKTQLEDAVGSMSQGLVMVDTQGDVVLCNPQTRDILALPQGPLDPRALFDDLLESQTEHGQLEGSEPTSNVGSAVDSPDGSISRTVSTSQGRHVELNSRRMQSGYTVHTYTDVTSYVRSNEQLRVAMQGMTLAQERLDAEMRRARTESDMKLRFVTSVSHEIRTPLNGIMGMVDVIERSGLNELQAELIADVRTSTTQLRQLTDDILDLSALQEAKFPLALAPFDLSALVIKVVRAAQGAAQASGIAVELLMREAPCNVIGDAQRLQQILNNLIYNAIKFTAKGWVRVHADWQHPDSAGNVGVIISIADSGRGIAAESLDSIFEPFHQGDESINRDFGGTGLGLALCRELCEAMGGSIRATSLVGQGSVFTVGVMLQSAEGTAIPVDVPAESALDAGLRLEGRRILVVDDNNINRKLLSIWLSEAGAAVHIASDGAEGLRAATAEPFDAVLMDVSMPVMNGLDATRAIRLLALSADEAQRLRSSVPVIGVTAMARPEDLKRCHEAGMDLYLSKPLSRGKLLRMLTEMIAAHSWLRHNGWPK
jgi:signal transduction histidine kinase/CheY-like chemotaxis protein